LSANNALKHEFINYFLVQNNNTDALQEFQTNLNVEVIIVIVKFMLSYYLSSTRIYKTVWKTRFSSINLTLLFSNFPAVFDNSYKNSLLL
jgi:hypothetical protein